MNSICFSCIVRSMCKHFCVNWFKWSYKIVPRNMIIELSEFINLTGDYGPIKNYYQKQYIINSIMLEDIPKRDVCRVCLSISE